MKCNNICITGVPEGKEREQGIENLFEEVMTENIPNLVKEKYKSRNHREAQTKWTQRGSHKDIP